MIPSWKAFRRWSRSRFPWTSPLRDEFCAGRRARAWPERGPWGMRSIRVAVGVAFDVAFGVAVKPQHPGSSRRPGHRHVCRRCAAQGPTPGRTESTWAPGAETFRDVEGLLDGVHVSWECSCVFGRVINSSSYRPEMARQVSYIGASRIGGINCTVMPVTCGNCPEKLAGTGCIPVSSRASIDM